MAKTAPNQFFHYFQKSNLKEISFSGPKIFFIFFLEEKNHL